MDTSGFTNTATTADVIDIDQMLLLGELIQGERDRYQEERDKDFAKIFCPICGRGVRALNRGYGEEWEMCGHMIAAIERQVPRRVSEPPSLFAGAITGVRLVLLDPMTSNRQAEPETEAKR